MKIITFNCNKAFRNKFICLKDFNANALWDKKHKVDDFEHHFLYLTKNFGKLNFDSVYHYINNIEYGLEMHPTLYFRKNILQNLSY